MTLFETGLDLLWRNLDRYDTLFTNPVERFYWMYLLAFLVGGAALYLFVLKTSGQKSFLGCLRFVFPKDHYLNNSTLLDLKLYLVNRFFGLTRFVGLVFGTLLVANWTLQLIESTVGFAPFDIQYTPLVIVAFTFYSVMVGDFGSFANHAIHHRIPILWEIHRVHHSAEVLTPLTQHRKHPIYDVNRAIIRSLIVGVLIAPAFWLLGDDPTVWKILGINAVAALFNFTANFRHSHIWICYGPILSRILVSPAQHQIHHSAAKHHYDKNFGQTFAIWDWMFGTLYVPKERETLEIGVDTDLPQQYNTLWQAYWRPAERILAILKSYLQPSSSRRDEDGETAVQGATPKTN